MIENKYGRFYLTGTHWEQQFGPIRWLLWLCETIYKQIKSSSEPF